MFSPWLHQMALDRTSGSGERIPEAPGANQIRIRVIDAPLILARVSRSDLESCLKPLLQLALFPTPNTFFSFTEVDTEVSLILDSASLALFPSEILTLSSQKWKAIEIYEGEAAIDQTGIVRRFSEPLARAGIQIIYLSAYYSDLILVEEASTEAAMACLRADVKTQASPGPLLAQYTFISVDSFESATSTLDPTTSALLSAIPSELALACLSRSRLSEFSHHLLQLILFPTSDDRFFSLTSYGGEVSLILQRAELDAFGEQPFLLKNSNTWEALHVQSGPSGVTGTGVVTSASSVLAEKDISIFYLSTFNSDYILVPSHLAPHAVQCLQGRA